jgi:O-antigen/teichoic acid export membrane protein
MDDGTRKMTLSKIVGSQEQENLITQAAKSFKWSILYNIAPRLVTPFSTIILAGLLTPSDFGLVAISTFVIALATILSELGIGRTVIQYQTNIEAAASVSMWMGLITSLGIYFLLWTLAPIIAVIYNDPLVTPVIRVAALSLPLAATTTVPKALLRRNMEFERLFWVNSSFLIISAIASVVLAYLGTGFWAIIFGQLIGLFVSSVIVWVSVRWRPHIVLNWLIARSILGFSTWIMLSNFQNWLFIYADNAIAGMFMGMKSLGVYALGFNIATIIPTFIVASLSDVAYPAFCRLDGNKLEVGKSLLNLQRLTGAILFPAALGIAAIATPVVELLYGNKWQGLGTVISILVIMPGLGGIWLLNESAYTALGKPDIYTKLSIISLLALLPILWFSAPYGLLIFTVARFVGGLFLPFGNILMGKHTLNLKISIQIRSLTIPLLYSSMMFISVLFLTLQLQPFTGILGWMKLFSIAMFGAALYILMIRFLNRELWNDLVLSVRRILAR